MYQGHEWLFPVNAVMSRCCDIFVTPSYALLSGHHR